MIIYIWLFILVFRFLMEGLVGLLVLYKVKEGVEFLYKFYDLKEFIK